MRLFSIIQWHHFAYMMISLALLGYGVSGAFLMLRQRSLLQRFAASYILNLALFGFCSVVCFLLAQHIPFNAEEVLWDPGQTLWLLCTYLLLAVPFFFAANAIGLALIHYRDRLSRIYAADLVGAGLGSIGILLLLFVVTPMQTLTVLGLLGLGAALVAVWELRQGLAAAWLLLPLTAVLLLIPASWSTLEMSPYKGLRQMLLVKDTHIIAERSSPLGLLSVVESPSPSVNTPSCGGGSVLAFRLRPGACRSGTVGLSTTLSRPSGLDRSAIMWVSLTSSICRRPL